MATNSNYPARRQTQQPQKQNGTLTQVKSFLNTEEMKSRFSEILGQKAPQFMASIVNAVSSNSYLQKCDAGSVIQSALIAATYDLPIDNNLGFSAIVPYKDKAQFQMMYKGFIQLAIRSGEYEDMNCSEVYEDELISYNPITGEVKFTDDFSKTTQRVSGQVEKIVGYYAWFRLIKGFTHGLYMTRGEVDNHAKKYSQAYQRDLSNGWNSSRWSQDFDAMAKKTVIKQLLSKWGILSIDMQRAVTDDQKVFDADGNGLYYDNPENTEAQQPEQAIDVFAAEVIPEVVDAPKQTTKPQQQKKAAPKAQAAPEPQPQPQQDDWNFGGGFDDDAGLPWN